MIRIAMVFIIFFMGLAPAQVNPPQDVVERLTLTLNQNTFSAGDTISGTLVFSLVKGWHVNSPNPLDPFLIPTKLLPDSGVHVLEQDFPLAETLALMGDITPVLKDTVSVRLKLLLTAQFVSEQAAVRLQYQGCNDRTCLLPRVRRVPLTHSVQTIAIPTQPTSELSRKILGFAPAVRLVFLFFMGLLLSLNPCVFPILPLTVTFFINQGKSGNARIVLLGLLYFLGMTLLFSAMGLGASLTGTMLAFLFQQPFFLVGIALVLLAMALSMFGLFEIRLPAFLSRYGTAKQGYAGAFFMGLLAGIFTLPCTSGPLAALMTLTALFKSPFWGFVHFMALGSGLGMPFFVLSLFTGRLSRLPHSGDWMLWVRKFFGFLILAVILFFIRPLLGSSIYHILGLLLILVMALFLGFINKDGAALRGFVWFKRIFSLGLAAWGLWFFLPALCVTTTNSPWKPFESEALKTALQNRKTVAIDFSAQWCAKCKQMERTTLADSAVLARLSSYTLFRADLTVHDSQTMDLAARYNILGLPTIIFVGRDEREIPDTRMEGFLQPRDFLLHLQKIDSVTGE